jgi:hypothetical protein
VIKPEQIPDDVVEELHAIFADDFGTLIPKDSCRAAIAAAINAWPGIRHGYNGTGTNENWTQWFGLRDAHRAEASDGLILPLTQEPRT